VRGRVLSCVLPVAAIAAARAVVAMLGVAVVACEVPTAPRGTALTPPSDFSDWWKQVEACSGITGDQTRISWYVVPCEAGEAGFKCDVTPDSLCAGEWRAPHDIQLGGPNRFFPVGYVDDEWTVKHEMLHDLLGRADHPKEFEDCGLMRR